MFSLFFRIGLKVAYIMFVLGTTGVGVMVCTGFEVAGDFGPVFVEGKTEYFE